MLKVTYEIIPFGREDDPRRRVICTQKIGLQKNVDGIGHYVSAMHHDAVFPPNNDVVTATNERSLGAFELVRKLLEKHCGPTILDGTSLHSSVTESRPEQPERGTAD